MNNIEQSALADSVYEFPEVKLSESILCLDDQKNGAHDNSSTTLTHRSSAFFASPACYMFRTTSPYRRALRQSMKGSGNYRQHDLLDSKYLTSLSEINLPIRRDSSPESEKDARLTCTDSVYSCETEDAGLTLSKGAVPSEAGMPELPAIRSEGEVAPIPDLKPRTLHQRDISIASSVEWKTRLSSKVSNMESPIAPRRNSPEDSSDCRPPLGHIREGAQLESPNECNNQTKTQSIEPSTRRPVAMTEGNARSELGNADLDMSCSRLALWNENEAPGTIHRPERRGNWPPIPPRNWLRSVPSLPNERRGCEINSPDAEPGTLQVRSFNVAGMPGTSESAPDEVLQKRRTRKDAAGWHESPTKSSPGLTSAVERQFMNPSTGSPINKAGLMMDTSTPRSRRRIDRKGEDTEASRLKSRDSNGSLMGSKQMVDTFLDSRRKKSQVQGLGNGAGSSPAMLL
ncbi:hypothetical protein BGZ63DRAFT_372601 [Mariannaea sp. PMI_226]|nr:hypothetical protein BGZ63DRAFT_372601 [Mariannaea sp. PMI_226]